MVQYNKLVINKLLDTYESSLLSTGDNVRTVNIEFRFSKKSFPAYFDESSLEYENVHIMMAELEERKLLRIVWKGKKAGHIIEKVQLNIDNLPAVYDYAKRIPKQSREKILAEKLEKYIVGVETPVCRKFAEYLMERLQKHKSVKEFVDLENCDEAIQLLDLVQSIEKNERQLYLREFSILVLNDSKALEHLGGKITSVFRRFKQGCEGLEQDGILADYNIYRTPNYVYMKGNAVISVGTETIDLTVMKQGIGISGEDIDRVKVMFAENVKTVITIENLTTFFRWDEKDSLIIYLGGYHNAVRRRLLKEIYAAIPDRQYYHFGDIDAGGFAIYRDLCEKSGIPFSMYRMDLETLKRYEKYGKPLTDNDRKRLERMREQPGLSEVVTYMLEHNVKLEQEVIGEVQYRVSV